MQDYQTPEHGAYRTTRYNIYKCRKRTGFTWLYNIDNRLTRERPDVRPGTVSLSIISKIEEIEESNATP